MKGSNLPSYDAMLCNFEQNLGELSIIVENISTSDESKHLDDLFNAMSANLQEIGAAEDPIQALLAEQACILYEKEQFCHTQANTARYQKQLSGVQSAIDSVKLIQNHQEYQDYVKQIPDIDLTEIPKGAPHNVFIASQNMHLEKIKALQSSAIKHWFTARQSLLRLTWAMIKKEQAAALNLPYPSK